MRYFQYGMAQDTKNLSTLKPSKEAPTHSKKKRIKKELAFYLICLAIFVASIWFVATVVTPMLSQHTTSLLSRATPFSLFKDSVLHHLGSPIGLLLLQIIVILTMARAVGWIFNKLHQPQVIGEIVAGIMLGPTLLGVVWPEFFSLLFPSESIANIELLSTFGLILFMFTIGMELRMSEIRKQLRNALIISQVSIFFPFVLGMLLAIALYHKEQYEAAFFPMALFMGIAMSITAFPVLARIIQERSMNRTPLGKMALNTAAAGDIFAWLLLAAIIAVAQSGSFTSSLYNFLFLLLYMLLIFGVIRPIFLLIGKMYNKNELISKFLVGIIFILLLSSAYLTEILSMHALFGAFMLGLIMPENLRFRHIMTEKVEDVSLAIFLPLFFVSSGLKTDLRLINSWEMVSLTILFVIVAVIGKVGGTYMASRVCGINRRDSLYMGAFMNTRGLMELVVLKIGLDLKILPPVLFAILVLMTVLTTMMTAPMIHAIDWIRRKTIGQAAMRGTLEKKILIAFGRSQTGLDLLRLARQMFANEQLKNGISLMHTTYDQALSSIDEESYFSENFSPLLEEARNLQLSTDTIYRVTEDVTGSIVDTANNGDYRFLLVGAGLSLSDDREDKEALQYLDKLSRRIDHLKINSHQVLLRASSLFNDKMSIFADQARTHLGIFVPRPFSRPQNIFIAMVSDDSADLSAPAITMAQHNAGCVRVIELFSPQIADVSALPQKEHDIRKIYEDKGFSFCSLSPLHHWPEACDFLLISYKSWLLISEAMPHLMEHLPPTLIIRPYEGLVSY